MSALVLAAAVDNWLGLGLGVVLLAFMFLALLRPGRF